MISLKQRTSEEGITHHKNNPVRVYTEDFFHAPRIAKSVELAHAALAQLGEGRKRIAEFGCGTGDISGQLSLEHNVCGVDCHRDCIVKARERWLKSGNVFPDYVCADLSNVEAMESIIQHGDLLILCEILEHLTEPLDFVKRWLPRFKTVLISHPLDGDMQGDYSGGDHCWSYSLEDFENWFRMGGHVLQSTEIIPAGGYNFIIGWGKREDL